MEDGWDKDKNYLNTTRDIKLSNVYNLITITDLSGNYSNNTSYQIDSTAKLDADNTSVAGGTAVTFTPSLTSNTEFNDIKSTSYSVKNGSNDVSVLTIQLMVIKLLSIQKALIL